MSDIPPRRLFPSGTDLNPLHAPPPVGRTEFIQSDVICSGCGYNLRGQSRDGRCPECGLAIIDAVRGGRLIYADKAWLMRVRSGVRLLFWGIIAVVVLMVAMMIAGIWHGLSQMGQPTPQFQRAVQIPSVLSGLVSVAYGVLVLHRLTTPEPSPGDPSTPERRGKARLIMTLAWIALVLQVASTFVFLLWGPEDPSDPSTGWIIYSVANGVLGTLGYVVMLVLLLLHLRTIARRDRTPALGKLFTVLTWSGAATMLLVGFAGAAMLLMAVNMNQGAFFATSTSTTQVAGGTVTFSMQSGGASTVVVTQPASTTTTAPYTSPSNLAGFTSAMFMLMPFMVGANCLGFVVFILGIIAAIQFHGALSWGIKENVGMPLIPLSSGAFDADSRPSD